MFERIQRCTAVKKYLKEHPGTTQQEALAACKAEKFQGGIKLAPKDLRDYFGTVVAGRISDPNALMRLMRHASLNTRTKYMRKLHDSMKDALQPWGWILGADLKPRPGIKRRQNDIGRQIAALRQTLLKYRNIEGNFGGGGQSRTADAADMSRVL